MSCKRLIVSAIVTPNRLSHCNWFDYKVILNLPVFSAGQFCVVRNSSSRNLWKNILQIWQQSRDSCKVRINFSLFFFRFTIIVIRYINNRNDGTIQTKTTVNLDLILNLKRHKQLRNSWNTIGELLNPASFVSLHRKGVRSIIALLPLLGVTSLLGFFIEFHYILTYLFILLNSTQVK